MLQNGCCCMQNDSLLPYAECPDYLNGNQYVKHGYRVGLTNKQCIASIFKCSNELINIWSHILGSVLFTYYLYHINMNILSGYDSSQFIDHFIMSLSCLCFIACLLFSASYHVFFCKSKTEYNFWLKLDLLGITLSLFGCYIPAIYYGFYCFKMWKLFYTTSVILLMLVNVIFQLCSRHIYTQRTDYKRILFFCVVVLFGIIPSVHWLILCNGFTNPLVQIFIPIIIRMYVLGFIGFLFYLTKIPERLYPGWFDFIGSSHQCWHLVVLYAFYYWYHSILIVLDTRLQTNSDSCKSEVM